MEIMLLEVHFLFDNNFNGISKIFTFGGPLS